MKKKDRYDSLIKYYSKKYNLNWKLIKKQLIVESGADPTAESPVGAKGLMQFMPRSWHQWDDDDGDPVLDSATNPEENIEAGCRYMRFLYSKFPEIPNEKERYKMALASYNAGRGNVNKMLSYARKANGLPFSYAEWEKVGRASGSWQEWNFAKRFLSCVTGGNAQETINYVKKIMGE